MNRRQILRRLTPALLATGLAVTLLAPASAAAPAGAGNRLLATVLQGAEEVPANASPGVGVAVVKVDARRARVCYAVAVSGLSSPVLAAHIHKAPRGANGPVVVNFIPPVDGFSSACVAVDAALAKDIARHPAEYYVNVHTDLVRPGEVRGQLRR